MNQKVTSTFLLLALSLFFLNSCKKSEEGTMPCVMMKDFYVSFEIDGTKYLWKGSDKDVEMQTITQRCCIKRTGSNYSLTDPVIAMNGIRFSKSKRDILTGGKTYAQLQISLYDFQDSSDMKLVKVPSSHVFYKNISDMVKSWKQGSREYSISGVGGAQDNEVVIEYFNGYVLYGRSDDSTSINTNLKNGYFEITELCTYDDPLYEKVVIIEASFHCELYGDAKLNLKDGRLLARFRVQQ